LRLALGLLVVVALADDPFAGDTVGYGVLEVRVENQCGQGLAMATRPPTRHPGGVSRAVSSGGAQNAAATRRRNGGAK
jgi:hypothetical protein